MNTMPPLDTMKTWLLAILFVVPTAQPTSAAQEPARARQAYDRAIALEAEGNQSAALSLLWEASGLAPRDADIQNRLGEALERIGVLDVLFGLCEPQREVAIRILW